MDRLSALLLVCVDVLIIVLPHYLLDLALVCAPLELTTSSLLAAPPSLVAPLVLVVLMAPSTPTLPLSLELVSALLSLIMLFVS
jgi:hypothetical protein